MAGNPIDALRAADPAMVELLDKERSFALSEGALSRKTKLLIAVALDASLGAEAGVKSLAGQALAAGASKAEILEAVRVAHFISGAGALYAAARGLEGII